jgi:hypothetical protein
LWAIIGHKQSLWATMLKEELATTTAWRKVISLSINANNRN